MKINEDRYTNTGEEDYLLEEAREKNFERKDMERFKEQFGM